MFDSIVILSDFDDSKSVSVKTVKKLNKKKKTKFKLFLRKVKIYMIKSKPVLKFMKIYINCNAVFKLFVNVFLICTIPSNTCIL